MPTIWNMGAIMKRQHGGESHEIAERHGMRQNLARAHDT